jgi:uncharacterized protein YdhG (YjbR/CyaY superfamily)
MPRYTTVPEYLDSLTPPARERIEQLRALLKSTLPETVAESISYQIIGYKLGKFPVIYIAGFAKHTGVYPITTAIQEKFQKELTPYKMGRGSVQFPHNQPLPLDLIQKLVQERLNEAA